jgi:hypothetical protein
MPSKKPNGTIPHRAGTKQINLWVDEVVLARWDAFAKGYGTNRTKLILAGVNEFIEHHGTGSQNGSVSKLIEQKFAELKEVLDQKSDLDQDQAVVVNDPKNRARILKVLERGPADSETLSFLLNMQESLTVEILSELKKDGFAKIDKRGTWHAENTDSE